MDENRATQDIPASLKQIGFLYVLGAEKIPKDLSRELRTRKSTNFWHNSQSDLVMTVPWPERAAGFRF